MRDVIPQYEWFLRLQELKIAEVKDDKWGFTEKFVESVREMNEKSKRYGRIKYARLAYGFSSKMASTIIAYPSFRNKENLDCLCGSYINLNYYLKKIRKKKQKKLENLVYTIWYIDEHYPKVEDTII